MVKTYLKPPSKITQHPSWGNYLFLLYLHQIGIIMYFCQAEIGPIMNRARYEGIIGLIDSYATVIRFIIVQ